MNDKVLQKQEPKFNRQIVNLSLYPGETIFDSWSVFLQQNIQYVAL